MSKSIYECRWNVWHKRAGKVIWELLDKKNLLVDEGEKALVDTFFRDRGTVYFPVTNFYLGLYSGTVAEATVLATIPGEPPILYGYSRTLVERSTIGWPTIEKHDGDWRVVSKEIDITAVGGNIGPVNGSFLGTSLDNAGFLIGSLAWPVERTVIAGDTITLQMKAKLK